jgi:hypothetical protein
MRRAFLLFFALALAATLAPVALGPSPAGAAGLPVGVAPAAAGSWTVDGAGQVTALGGAPHLGSAPPRLARPIVGMASTPSRAGYWLVASDGGIFTFGDATFLGSTGAIRLAQPIVGMAATPSGRGYWLVAADGGIFTFGDAGFLGSTGAIRLARPIVAMASTPTGRGYWLAASDGGIFTFGDARFLGSAGGLRLASPVVGMARSKTGSGYWLVAGDGAVLSFGDAAYAGRTDVPARAVAAAGGGYRVAATDGSVTTFVAGTAPSVTGAPIRDAFRWPFATTSPWNMPVGANATYESASSPRTSNLNDARAKAWVNARDYSAPIYRAAGSDPLATVNDGGRISQYRIPAGAQPSNGTDGALFIVDPSGRWVDETWRMSGGPLAWSTSYHVRNDLRGSGWGSGGVRAAGGSGIGGIIRHWEVDAGVIRHGLALSVADFQLARGPVWPATAEDGNAASVYKGLNPIGTFAAIPPTVDVTTLGLSREGLMLAHALQDYGSYVVDRNSSSFVLKADPSLDGTSALSNMRRDLATLRPHLRVVTNNTPTSVNGGGTPRAPLAPQL